MQYTQRLLVIFGIALSVFASPSLAKFVPQVYTEAGNKGSAYVIVNKQKVIEIKTPNGNLSAADRANIVAKRLTDAVTNGLDPKTLWYKKVGQNANVMLGESMLLMATKSEAAAHKLTASKLSEMWVHNLREALSAKPLSASPTSMLVPLGETRVLNVVSLLQKPAQFEVSNPSILTWDSQKKPGSLYITGTSVGGTTITIRCEEYTAQAQITVRKYAGSINPGITKAFVTGWNAPASLISRAARDAARRAISVEPGASISSINIISPCKELAPGKTYQTSVEVKVEGRDFIPVALDTKVEVGNRPLDPVPTSWLMYSNAPERISKYQTLFAGSMTATQEAFRLLYHHQNVMRKRIGFVIDVVNTSTSPASFHLIEGVSRPMIDTVDVGYRAGLAFLENHRDRVGRIIELPAGTHWAIVSQSLDSPYTASGILELRQMSGDPLFIRIMAKPENQRVAEDPMDTPLPSSAMKPEDIHISDHVYPGPIQNLEVTYTYGKPWVFIRIGKYALKHATLDKQLFGNYGVTYDIKATIENPTDSPRVVELAYEATAGPVSGLFIVDGNMVRVKSLQAPQETSIGEVTIPAGKKRVVSIRTMPLSGSAYPTTLIIRPTGMTR